MYIEIIVESEKSYHLGCLLSSIYALFVYVNGLAGLLST